MQSRILMHSYIQFLEIFIPFQSLIEFSKKVIMLNTAGSHFECINISTWKNNQFKDMELSDIKFTQLSLLRELSKVLWVPNSNRLSLWHNQRMRSYVLLSIYMNIERKPKSFEITEVNYFLAMSSVMAQHAKTPDPRGARMS